MASTNIFTFPSSPPPTFTTFTMSSSPPLPSPSELFKHSKPPIIRTGSCAAPIPAGAVSAFVRASSLSRKESVGSLQGTATFGSIATNAIYDGRKNYEAANPQQDGKPTAKRDVIEKAAKAPRKTAKNKEEDIAEGIVEKKPHKPRAKKLAGDTGDTAKVKTPRKSRAKKADSAAGDDAMPKEKPVRKPRAKKTDKNADTQPKIPKGPVIKTSTTVVDKGSSALDGTVSKHFANKPGVAESVPEMVEEQSYGLEEATKRRKNWTPAKSSSKPAVNKDDPEEHAEAFDTSSKEFAQLLGSFGFNSQNSNIISEKRLSDAPVPTRKRKLIEMITTNMSKTNGLADPKEHAVKKKPRTITERATAAYISAECQDTELLGVPGPLDQYLSNGSNDGFKPPTKSSSKSPTKAMPKPKKGTAAEPILLSPESALKQVSNQDFVFGTFSQLAREESPTLLRDMHLAMQQSNEIDDLDDPFATPVSKVPQRARTVTDAKRNLWSVAARDDQGDVMDVGLVDLVTPVAKPQNRFISTQSSTQQSSGNDNLNDIDDFEYDRPPSTQVETRQLGPVEMSIRTQLASSSPRGYDTVRSFSTSPPPQAKAANPSPTKKTTSPKKAAPSRGNADPSMPDYSLLTDIQLAKEIKKIGFKPIKNRNRMINLLKQCWESSNRPALGILQGNISIQLFQEQNKEGNPAVEVMQKSPSRSKKSAMTVTSPKRGRPRKDDAPDVAPKPKAKGKSKITTVEYLEMDSDTPLSRFRTPKKPKIATKPTENISDSSDSPLTPSPPRRSPSQIRKSASALQLSPSIVMEEDEEEEDLTPSAQQEQLFKHISLAITNAPPTKDPANPSWHEKILLYDPIVLEDLTAWLNTGALGKVGWDDETHPKVVKMWCERRSICCLWKENQSGGTRSRY